MKTPQGFWNDEVGLTGQCLRWVLLVPPRPCVEPSDWREKKNQLRLTWKKHLLNNTFVSSCDLTLVSRGRFSKVSSYLLLLNHSVLWFRCYTEEEWSTRNCMFVITFIVREIFIEYTQEFHALKSFLHWYTSNREIRDSLISFYSLAET